MEPTAKGQLKHSAGQPESCLRWSGAQFALFVIGLGVYGLVSWAAKLPVLTTFGLMTNPLSPRTAFVFVLIGSAMFLLIKYVSSPASRYAALVALLLAFTLCLFCTLTRVQSAQPHIATKLNQTAQSVSWGFATPMSKINALLLILVCTVLFARTLGIKRTACALTGSLGMVIVLVNLVELLGQLYGSPNVWGEKITVPHNALINAGAIGIGLALFFASDIDRSPLRGFIGSTQRAKMARLFIPGAFLLAAGLQLCTDLLFGMQTQNPALQNLMRTLLVTAITALVIRLATKQSQASLPVHTSGTSEVGREPVKREAADPGTSTSTPLIPAKPVSQVSHQLSSSTNYELDNQALFGALEAIFPVFVMVYRQGKCIYANKAAQTILGRTTEQLQNCMAWDLVHPEMRQLVCDRILRRESGEDMPARREYPILTAEGQIRWVDLAATRIQLDGQPAVLICGLDITQRKQMEEQLRASEEQFRQVVEHIRQVFWIRDYPEKNLLYVSPAYEVIWGRSRESLYESPKSWFQAVIDEDRGRVQKAFANLKALGKYHEIYRIERPDGTIRWIEDRAFPVLNERGAVYRIAGIAEDITERKRAEAALKESETTFKTIFAKASEGMFLLDWQKRSLIMCNPACSKLLAYKPDEFPKLNMSDLVASEDFKPFADQITKFIKSGRWQPRDFRFVRKDKSVIFVDLSPALVTLNGKKTLLISFKDITKRKQMEEALRASEEQFRTLFESAPIGVALLAPNGRYLQVNQTYCSMLRYPANAILKLNLFDVIHPEDTPTTQKLLSELVNAKCDHFEREVRCCTRDGQALNILLAASAVRNPDGQVRYIVSTALDITEAKRLQNEVIEISEQERCRIGHDLHDGLGQYLSGIALKAKCLQQTLSEVLPSEAAAVDELITLIKIANTRARALAKGLDPGNVEADDLVLALSRLATECEQIFSIQCNCAFPSQPVPIENGKAKHLYMIAQEAINNAVKHGKASNVNLELAAQNGTLRLLIRDDGSGFDPSCDPDAGLGLRIMKYRARSIGGNLNIRSQPGKGTQIECVLPLTRNQETNSTRQG